ncbi:hypothetical protein psyc5s11_30510 [Clostridium gelidum]|uniref:HNH domain-containing protein n=1 Tax=Clostridium gelidum TaxID=704125 RepID=A0ABN6IXX6_9CLOT|nr:hypothetical protein [Clostridium gelidum]BCZ46984.1 hypothetical protein psyc5s11_30510 [Clostridium gelidum]
MKNILHLVLKFPNITSIMVNEKKTDTITEHRNLCELNNRLIWGQDSDKKISGLAEKNRNRIKQQINDGINTYAFFLADKKGEKELYVGKMLNVYDKGEVKQNSDLINYIPSYYSYKVGTAEDKNNLFVDVKTFLKINKKYLSDITIESNKKNIMEIKNNTPVFLVNIDDKLDSLLNELLIDKEMKFQNEVELEEVPDSITVTDEPKEKPKKSNGSDASYYRRNPRISKTAIVDVKYQCEVDKDHKHFISKFTSQNYVEAHHLIPMEYQEKFDCSIDIEANVVSLCVCCHKKLHHGKYEEIKPLIERLYDERINRLNKCNINLAKEKLLTYYQK